MTGSLRAPRSLLAVPASRADLLASARRRPADALMVDLEDGVAPNDKATAREQLVRFLGESVHDDHAPRVLVRVNEPLTADGSIDLELLARLDEQHRALIHAVIVPKSDRPTIAAAASRTQLPLAGLIETAAGVEDAADVARVPGVMGLIFGSVDYLADVSQHGGWHLSDLSWVQHRIVNAAAAGGGWALAGPSTRIGDDSALSADIAAQVAAGFAGKLCIHPDQLDPVNEGFSPRADDLAWAHRVLEATGGVDNGAVKVDGQMIDKPLIEHARRLVRAGEGSR